MNSNSNKTIIAVAIIVFGFVGVFFLSNFLENNRPPLPEGYEDSDLALQGANLKGYALGAEGLIADWYWMKSLQYVGDKIVKTQDEISIDNLNNLNPRLLYPYLDNATTLDRHFMAAYSYGAIILPAVNKDQAIKLIEKGISDNPNEWRLYQYLGYIYWRAKNYEKASETYSKGAGIAGAPPFMKMMAAKMTGEGGSRDTARIIYKQMFDEATDPQIKSSAELRLLELDSLDERDTIRPVLKQFLQQNNRCINNWSELLPLLAKTKLPDGKNFRLDNSSNIVDPGGAPYYLDKTNCDVKLDLEKTKIPDR